MPPTATLPTAAGDNDRRGELDSIRASITSELASAGLTPPILEATAGCSFYSGDSSCTSPLISPTPLASATVARNSTSAASSPVHSPSPSSPSSQFAPTTGLSTPAIVGIALGVAGACAMVCAGWVFLGWRRRRRARLHRGGAPHGSPEAGGPQMAEVLTQTSTTYNPSSAAHLLSSQASGSTIRGDFLASGTPTRAGMPMAPGLARTSSHASQPSSIRGEFISGPIMVPSLSRTSSSAGGSAGFRTPRPSLARSDGAPTLSPLGTPSLRPSGEQHPGSFTPYTPTFMDPRTPPAVGAPQGQTQGAPPMDDLDHPALTPSFMSPRTAPMAPPVPPPVPSPFMLRVATSSPALPAGSHPPPSAAPPSGPAMPPMPADEDGVPIITIRSPPRPLSAQPLSAQSSSSDSGQMLTLPDSTSPLAAGARAADEDRALAFTPSFLATSPFGGRPGTGGSSSGAPLSPWTPGAGSAMTDLGTTPDSDELFAVKPPSSARDGWAHRSMPPLPSPLARGGAQLGIISRREAGRKGTQ